MTARDVLIKINGRDVSARSEPRQLLCDFLRDELGLTGTHIGCEHGICGACTILFDGEATRSCLMFAVQADGHDVQTIEGLTEGGKIADLQSSFSAHHALQCGYCTPGMLIIAQDFLQTHPNASQQDLKEAMSANLCRCTGYWNILDAVIEVATARRTAGAAKS
jgi:aerobic-type carbon monoxide dehydrogenase small subunit (CoxS/CutS family)